MGVDPAKAQRKRQRKGLTLQSSLVSPGLQHRYAIALLHVTQFWIETALLPSSLENVDPAVSVWLEYIFSDGEPKSLASDGLASLQHFMPSLCGHLRGSWKMVKAWQKLEPPTRVIPISPLLCQAMAGACVATGLIGEAAAFLLAFDAMLRPGELYHVLIKDISFFSDVAVVCLRDTKTGRRKNSSEMVVIESAVANIWLRKAASVYPKNSCLIQRTPAQFRMLFRQLVQHLELKGLWAIYSFRRGGATFDFLYSGSLERTLLRGRWSSSSTARIYLQDTVATVSLLELTPVQKSYASFLACKLQHSEKT